MPGQDDGVYDPEAGGALRAPTSEALQADHQAGASPHHQGGWSCSISWTTLESSLLSGVQHGPEGDLHVEVDQPAPGEEADPAEVVHKEEAGGANLSHMAEECQYNYKLFPNRFQAMELPLLTVMAHRDRHHQDTCLPSL